MTPPLVSVIVPNYNHARYLPQRLDSVLGQTFQNFEVILLDDCSTDHSRAVIAAYAARDARIRVVLNEKNSGSPFRQWDKGISLARGTYVWIAESDDWADSRFLATLTMRMQSDKEIKIAYAQSFDTDQEGNVQRDRKYWTQTLHATRWDTDYENEGVAEIAHYFVHKNIIPNASAALVLRSAIETTFLRKATELKMLGDWLIWCSILKSGKIAYCAEILNYFRHHSGTTRKHDTVEKKIRRIWEEHEVLKSISKYVNKKVYHRRIQDINKGWLGLCNQYGTRRVMRQSYDLGTWPAGSFVLPLASSFCKRCVGRVQDYLQSRKKISSH